jgi:hypothetical protein
VKLVLRKERKLPGDQLGRFASVDPGIGGSGWAVWERSTFGKLVDPIASGSERSYDDWPWERQVGDIGHRMAAVFRMHRVIEVYVELPQLMYSSAGQAAAASGDLVKLSMCAGSIVGAYCHGTNSWPVMVDIPSWKGNMPKALVAERIREKLPRYGFSCQKPTTHEVDAVGIGLYVKGYL